MLVLYIIWRVIDRKRLFELLTVGGLTLIFSTFIDIITVQYGLTGYPISLAPISPSLFTATLVIIPAIYMLLYQFFYTWKSFLFASVITGIFLAFIGENLLRWLDIYEYIQWNSFYSLIIYIAMAVIVKWIMKPF
jgi:uncharacterized membrane protein YeaQ/YmgE (transglycosylase-associated protein family)